ncbi:4,5-DOPA dioxygenase extradiol [Fusibacter sp. Q10-2]|uniref:4,5-DOPA dioxygenase extradiol n=2 Tax=Fusibacter ferrireducens TaxID=2785058 RepID=A0ABR9ZQY5_9FIRM|nr:4,5-DOPA dioxygenase extradiol [Fusibacter ferrireducens]
MPSQMPVLFIGHGSPMNAIRDNVFTQKWREIGGRLPTPKAILCVSAHWYTPETRFSNLENPEQIYDMYGFPKSLYEYKYPAKGSPEMVEITRKLLKMESVIDNSWGIDHGTWSVLSKLYPKADIPVYQMSINSHLTIEAHYALGQKLKSLRALDVLIIGSGNVVHNLNHVNFNMLGGYPYAETFDAYVKAHISNRNIEKIIHYEQSGESSKQAFYTLEHYLPLIYALGASDEDDSLEVFNDQCVAGSLSMTSYLWRSIKKSQS